MYPHHDTYYFFACEYMETVQKSRVHHVLMNIALFFPPDVHVYVLFLKREKKIQKKRILSLLFEA